MIKRGRLMANIQALILIVNETSGAGKGKKVADHIQSLLQQEQCRYRLLISHYPGHVIQLVKELIDSSFDLRKERIVIIGGDGTLHEALIGLGEEHADIPLGYIPAGSGNDFARGIGIDRDSDKALKQLLSVQEPQAIQVIQFDDHHTHQSKYAVNNFGIGFDADVIMYANRSSIKKILNRFKIGSLSYMISVAAVFFQRRTVPLTLTIDHQKHFFQEAFLITVNSHPYFGGGINISPKADPRNTALDLIVLEKQPLYKVLWLILLLLYKGSHLEHKDVYYYNGINVHLQTSQQSFAQADGEELGKDEFDVTLHKVTRYFWC